MVNTLHTELLMHCFSFLPLSTIPSATGTCRKWKEVLDSNFFWQQICFRQLGELPQCGQKSWKELLRYRELSGCIENLSNSDFTPRKEMIPVPLSLPEFSFFLGSLLIRKIGWDKVAVWNLETETKIEEHEYHCIKNFSYQGSPVTIEKTALLALSKFYATQRFIAHASLNHSWAVIHFVGSFYDQKHTLEYSNSGNPEQTWKVSIQLNDPYYLKRLHLTQNHIFVLDNTYNNTSCTIFFKNGKKFHELNEKMDFIGFNDQFVIHGFRSLLFRFNLETKENKVIFCRPARSHYHGHKVDPLYITPTHYVYEAFEGGKYFLFAINIKTKELKPIALGFQPKRIQNLGKIFLCSDLHTAVFVDIETTSIIRTITIKNNTDCFFDFYKNKLIVNMPKSIKIFEFSTKAK